jgi:hypothetical protein
VLLGVFPYRIYSQVWLVPLLQSPVWVRVAHLSL